MIYSAQIRAARGLLGWSQNELAAAAELGVSTVKRMEASATLVQGNGGNIWRLQEVLVAAGLKCRLRPPVALNVARFSLTRARALCRA